MILLDLFSGTGGFHKGLEEGGMKFSKVYFSEIDKHAIANYKYNYPNAEYIGSVTNVRHIIRTIGKCDIITFGSPCQDFSLAGKRMGMEGQRSSLIKYSIFLIKWLRPDIFIWENVKGAYSSNNSADYWAIMQAFTNIDGYRCEGQLLNTAWFLPQNRERIYVVGHSTGSKRNYGEVFPIGEELTRTDEGISETPNVRAITGGGHSGGAHSGMTLVRHRSDQPFTGGGLHQQSETEIKEKSGLSMKIETRLNSSQDGIVFNTDGICQTLSAGHGNVPKIKI